MTDDTISGNTVVIPGSFMNVPNGWCDECQRLTPVTEFNDDHLCLRCQGKTVPIGVGLLPEEAEAVVTVEVTFTDSWDISRGDFEGTDSEWRDLIGILSTTNRTPEQRDILRRFERDQEEGFDRVGAHSEVFVDLLRPRKRVSA